MSNNRNNEVDRFSELFKALSNPHRLRILIRLVDCCGPGEICSSERMRACVGQLGQDLGIAPSTTSHHVKELHRAGLIQMQRRGQNIDCWVDSEAIDKLEKFFSRLVQGS